LPLKDPPRGEHGVLVYGAPARPIRVGEDAIVNPDITHNNASSEALDSAIPRKRF